MINYKRLFFFCKLGEVRLIGQEFVSEIRNRDTFIERDTEVSETLQAEFNSSRSEAEVISK